MLLEKDMVSKLDVIGANYPLDVERCCSEMFKCWLRIDPEASWDTLILALKDINENTLIAKIEKDILKGS